MTKKYDQCNNKFSVSVHCSVPKRELDISDSLIGSFLAHFIIMRTPQLIPLLRASIPLINKKKKAIKKKEVKRYNLNLQPGEFVRVRTMEEIQATLDDRRKLRGLYFMNEMDEFCGKEYRVFKKVEKYILESTGEMRSMKSPTYYLEGVYCNGSYHNGCDKSCFLMWKEEWLERVQPKQ